MEDRKFLALRLGSVDRQTQARGFLAPYIAYMAMWQQAAAALHLLVGEQCALPGFFQLLITADLTPRNDIVAEVAFR